MNAGDAFSTASIPPQDRAGRWKAAIAETYFPLELTFQQTQKFDGRLVARGAGRLGLSRLSSDPVVYERRAKHLKNAQEEEYLVTIPVAAPVEFRQLGRDVLCAPGCLVVERGDEPYRFLYRKPNDLHVVKVPRSAIAERVSNPDEACARIIDAGSGAAALFVSMVQSAHRHLDGASTETVLLAERHLLELLAGALAGIDAVSHTSSAVRAAHLTRAEAFIQAHIRDPALRPDLIAAACGISKRYLHDLYRDRDESVSRRIRDLRLEAARDLIVTHRRLRIADAAYRYGFSDQGQFTRLFKARFGQAPKHYRANHS